MAIVGIDLGTSNSAAAVLQFRNKGFPQFGGKGGLYLQVKLRVAERLSREERELNERLRELAGKPKRHFWG